MKVKVVGKRFAEGTSKKTNKPYSGFFVSYEYSDKNYEGVKAGEAFFATQLLQGQVPSIGDTMIIDYDQNGYVASVDVISAPVGEGMNLNGGK